MKLSAVLLEIDRINQQDPNTIEVEGQHQAKEFIYSQQMTDCLLSYWPNADEELQIAVRAQHLKRWHLKRAEFPEGRKGYLDWRKKQGQMHAELTQQIMIDKGYSDEAANRVGAIIRKEKLKSNPQSQTLEDVACLVFLMHYFDDFAQKYPEDKIISIVQKTWRKMSDQGHQIALKLTLPVHLAKLVEKALS